MPSNRDSAYADGLKRADGRRVRGFTPLGWAVIVLVGLVIVAGLVLLVSLIVSSSSSSEPETPASVPAASAVAPSVTSCSGTEWLDPSTGVCAPRTVCPSAQQYEPVTNTCIAPQAPPPDVTAIEPSSGLASGGTEVRITGSGFQPGATVTIDDVPAADVTVVSDTAITATTPGSKSLFPVDVEVANPDGPAIRLDNAFVYVAVPVKRVTAVVPTKGSRAGGEAVVVKGVDFVEGMIVTFGGRAATDVTILNPNTVRVTTPPGTTGPVTVTVRNPGGEPYARQKAFTYTTQAPRAVTAVRPVEGAVAGGTKVTIAGTGFANGADVTFGGKPASKVDVVSSTRITAVVPRGELGSVIVGVRNPGLPAAFLADGFTYVEAPTIAKVTPAEGPVTGGTKVTVTGTGFLDGATVTFDGARASAVQVVNDSTIKATTPKGAVGPAAVVVTNPDQPAARSPKGFTYVAAGTPPPTKPPTPPSTGPLPQCRPVAAPKASTPAGSGLFLTDVDLFPSSAKVTSPTLTGATFAGKGTPGGDGSVSWQATPPRIAWQAPDTRGAGGTITFTYQDPSCTGTGTGVIRVSAS